VVVVGGGTASGTTISNGGIQYDAGTALDTTLSGGAKVVYGSASGTTIGLGGYELALSGGTIGGATISGGTLELQSGSTAGSSTITFAGGGTLKLDGTGAFGFLVAGFAVPDAFDLSAVNFASATKGYVGNTSSGTLTVSDGTHSASILLLGNYSLASFNLAPEGGGGTGTIVTDPPLTGSSVVVPPH
jgi:autotransporter passenger strand-loop-strand repeat protein